MKKRNNLIKSFIIGTCLVFGITAAIVPQKAQSQYMWTCYTHNTLGLTFYWVHPNIHIARYNAMYACRENTPGNHFCIADQCR